MKPVQKRNSWPKQLPDLTPEQKEIREDFYGVWLTELPRRYGIIEEFNHRYALRSMTGIEGSVRTLEVGSGQGAHIAFENLDQQDYTALELRAALAQSIREKYPTVHILIGDIHEQLEVPAGYFNRILAIHVLEHLPNLPKALDEIQRLLDPAGYFSVVIPADPGLAYSLARNLSARRLFERRYKQSYDWFVACEHINSPQEIVEQLKARFALVHASYFPLLVPIIPINLVIGLTFKHQQENAT